MYFTGFEYYASTSKERESQVNQIISYLKIKKQQDKENILKMCEGLHTQKAYLFICFKGKALEDNVLSKTSTKALRFRSCTIALINYDEGCGNDTKIVTDITIAFDVNNLYQDDKFTFDYADTICGYTDTWANKTIVENIRKPLEDVIPVIANETFRKKKISESVYENVYNSGSCTIGDTVVKRHRNIVFDQSLNANICKQCGTMWLQ